MDVVKLNEIIEKHAKWLKCMNDGSRANLSGANLSGADLYGANLSRANLSGAVLYGANLSRANLSGADLYGADLYGANLSWANLYGADLYGANLSGADLYGANLSGANLYGANLYGADLSGADLSEIKNGELALVRLRICPAGTLIGWKKCRNGVIVKVEIASDTPRSNAAGRKCRASEVKVLEVFNGTEGISLHDGVTTYRVGETVKCDNWNDDPLIECGGGIHFFITREEAEAYY